MQVYICKGEVKKLFVPEEIARVFFRDIGYSFKAECPTVIKKQGYTHTPMNDLRYLEIVSLKDIGYATLGRCSGCGRALVVDIENKKDLST